MTYGDLTPDLSMDIIINLAGAGIADKRWSNARKQELFDSRLIPTQKLLDFIKSAYYKPKLLISGSAIGYYGIQALNDTRPLTENGTPICNDFSSYLCTNWENLANACDIKTAIIRTGVVLDKTGKGMLKKILPQFNFGLGGKLGNSLQTMSWISIDDWVQAVIFIMGKHLTDELEFRQIYNLTAPNSVNNQVFTQALGKFLNRPTVFVVPAFIFKANAWRNGNFTIRRTNGFPQSVTQNGV